MRTLKPILIAAMFLASIVVLCSYPRNYFMQGNNINTCFRTDGIFNYDWVTWQTKEAGFLWPASATTRLTADYATGIWIGAKVGPQRILKVAGSWYSSHFTPGNIPVVGQVPPNSVCSDTTWKGYYVQLTDPLLVNGGIRIKTAQGRQFTFRYDSWASWPVQKGAPFVEVNNIAGYQPGWNSDRPGIGNGSKARPDELLFMVYMDYSNCRDTIHRSESCLPGGSLPLGVEVQQLSFMFNCTALINTYFMKFKIINKSSMIWDSTYLSVVNDIDIGYGSCGANDDAAGCDTVRNLAFVYNGDNYDCNYGENPPALGTRMLQSPLKFTGNNNDTAKLPYDTLIGYKLIGMSTYMRLINTDPDPCFIDPDDAESGYSFMKAIDRCGRRIYNPITGMPTTYFYPGNACNRLGWIDSFTREIRYIQSSGPFTMNSRDTQIVVLSFNVTRDGGNNFQNVCALQSMSDSALKYYYNDFQTCIPIGIQPISSEVPNRFILYQNYPNPFNPSTKIRFSIPSEGQKQAFEVRLRIYDILGHEVTKLVNEKLKPGTYEIDWNAENYPSGVYFFTISSGNFFDSKKMILLR
jgi:hypothetical protein